MYFLKEMEQFGALFNGYTIKELPSSKVLSEHFANWTDYATIVSAYLWKSIALGLTQKSFNEAITEQGG